MPVLVEVNIDDQPSKAGVTAAEVFPFLEQLSKLSGIRVEGLMCIPDPTKMPDNFARMQQLFAQLKQASIPGVSIEKLSMGMSGDYKEAIGYGATYVRVGRGIFGARSYTPAQIADLK
jgi:uncharacterized pyridoxal phosphate-containing UPF0001 family protein